MLGDLGEKAVSLTSFSMYAVIYFCQLCLLNALWHNLELVAANVLIVMLIFFFIFVHGICILYFNNSFRIGICL